MTALRTAGPVVEIAPAKINFYLHVGPVRADGLHDLASLFVFAADGDRITAAPARDISLTIEGPYAPALSRFPVETNLVFRAARALQAASGATSGAAISLDKRLPIAAGVGGGSADAAATLRALAALWDVSLPTETMRRLAFSLGADVPACLSRRPVYVGGAGERVAPGPVLPPLWVCLVNPRVETPTGPIFRAFDRANPSPPPPARPTPSRIASLGALSDFLSSTRNDLEPFAILRNSVIGLARDFVAGCPGARFARMSGSGSTVFGLFSDGVSAIRAARAASARGWWALAAPIAADAGQSAKEVRQ